MNNRERGGSAIIGIELSGKEIREIEDSGIEISEIQGAIKWIAVEERLVE